MEEKFLRLANGVTVASEYLREKARKAGARRVVFIPNGTEDDFGSKSSKSVAREALGIRNSGVLLCHVGFADLGNVWNKIVSVYPKATLVIVGQPPKYNMRKIVKHDDRRVLYTGRIDPTLVKTYLAASDILLLKTNDEVSERARFPIRLGDYLSAERPVVAGDIGEIGRVLRESGCGVLSKPGDDEDFADRIIDLIAAPEVWDGMSAGARRMAEKLSWDNLARELDDFYRSV
jgi:glycosyltransferase involved in cell wall biosynthesis